MALTATNNHHPVSAVTTEYRWLVYSMSTIRPGSARPHFTAVLLDKNAPALRASQRPS